MSTYNNSGSNKHKTPRGFDLRSDEEIKWYGRKSWKSFFGPLMIGVGILFFLLIVLPAYIPEASEIREACGLPALGIFALGLVVVALRIHRTEYVITNKRVVGSKGLVGRATVESKLENVEDTTYHQGIIDRFLGIGNLGVRTAGTGGTEIVFAGLSNPQKVQRILRDKSERKKTNEKIQERIERLEDKHLVGQIDEDEFREAKNRLMEKMDNEQN